MRNKLFASTFAAGMIAVPAALAATGADPAEPARLATFQAFDKQDVRAFKKAQERREARQRRRQYQSVEVPPQLEAIAACESGGDPTAVSSSGAYRGKYQFSYGTWQSLGGARDPAAAPEAEQDQRAAALYAREGTSPWPVCGAGL